MQTANNTIRPTLRDALIILGLICYAWFVYDSDNDRAYQQHPASQQPNRAL